MERPVLWNRKSFEDKRKENFDKGQEELEKRRRALEEIQKKEEEERQRKAREEEERRERERVEAEARRQEEIRKMQEKERERQAALEAERQRQIEAKEAARREQERLAQLEWEKQKKTELLQMKQTQQEKVVNLKAQNQKMSIELSSLTSKIKELTEQVADTRAGIAGVKHSIDGMRTTRDSKVKAINDAKMSLKEQNQRLMNVVQEKAKLAEKSRKDGGSGIDGEEDAMAAAIQRKQATNKTLKEELETVTTENDALDKEVKSKLEELNTLKETMGECHLSAKKTYQTYLEKRQWIMDKREKEKKALYDPNAAWGASVDDTSFDAPAAAEPEPVAVRGPSETSDVERVKFVALYPFEARNPDEVNLDDRTGEEGWLQGDLENGGGSGWFPEAYAEKYDPAKHNGVAAVPEPQTVNFDAAFPPSSTEPEAPVKNESGFDSLVNHQDSFVGFQKDPFAPENAAQPTSGAPVAAEVTASEYVALYTYTSEEPGDLVFQQGQVIKVIAKDGDWWTGVLEDGSKGIFPANYVTPKEDAFADHFTAPASTANSVTPLEEPPKEEPVPPETQPAHLDGGTDEETDVSRGDARVRPPSDLGRRRLDSKTNREVEPKGVKEVLFLLQPKGVSKKILIAKVIAPYEATTKEQLSLQRGQLIQVYKKSSSGWWEGELQAKGQGRLRGWFPGTYVKVLAGSTSAVSSARTSPVPKSFLEGLGEPPLPSGKVIPILCDWDPFSSYLQSLPPDARIAAGQNLKKTGPKDDIYEVAIDVTGFRPEDLRVVVQDSMLVIEGKHLERQDEHGFIAREFVRRIVMPDNVKMENVTSRMTDTGMLLVTAPMHRNVPGPAKEIEVYIEPPPGYRPEAKKAYYELKGKRT
ncbi:unnamed protein product [Cyprideis torosa]|uniref:Uncharacterized protein n=1 Tax=Cyprideis torosa TaxID=163714 RepID=A0A7R8WAL3_9CRUS|nr:unnamed protein product [Cyprideis torosa]CAG0885438.1 unnamed protein product [Cyprideis torosa]